jgi:predicted nucleic acid-binding protein
MNCNPISSMRKMSASELISDSGRKQETQVLVINTGPVLALVAALGDLGCLRMYRRVWVPYEVRAEVLAGGASRFAATEFEAARWLHCYERPLTIAPVLLNTLDRGEASVIQLALDQKIGTVCIDEAAGRRMARLHNLSVTGSLGILLRAKREGYGFSMVEAIDRMKARGVWLSERVVAFALEQVGDDEVA